VTVRRAAGVAVLALLGTSVPGHAAAPPDRAVRATYSQPAGVTTGSDATLLASATVTATARSDEDRVTVSAGDSGGTVALVVDVTRPRAAATRTITCDRFAVPVVPGTTVTVSPLAGRCPDGRVSVPLGGSITLSFHRVPPPPPYRGKVAPPSLRWAVIIGVQDYAGNTESTQGGLGDARAVRAALLASGWLPDHIKTVTDADATAAGVRAAFSWLASRSGPRTFSLLHWSGHVCIKSRGPCAAGHTYLWPYDNRFIPESEVKQRWAAVRGYGWLDIAGCEAGAFDTHSATKLFSGSSRANETSYESRSWRQSFWAGLVWDRGFTRGLADDQGRAHRATIGEMTRYGVAQAPPMTAAGEKGSQHPVVAGGSGSWTLYAPPGG
jgi:hypothetical protein